MFLIIQVTKEEPGNVAKLDFGRAFLMEKSCISHQILYIRLIHFLLSPLYVKLLEL